MNGLVLPWMCYEYISPIDWSMFFLPSHQSLAQPSRANDSIGNTLGTHGSAARVFSPYTHGPFRPAVSQPEDWRYRRLLRHTEQTGCVLDAP